MLIDLRKLLSGSKDSINISAVLDMNVFDTGICSYEIVEKPEFPLSISKIDKNKFSIKCAGFVSMNIPCDRCLESVLTRVNFDIDFEEDLKELSGRIEEQEEKDYIDGYNLDVDRLVFGELLLSMPGKTVCSDDCKGLCPVCGMNLNITECGCDRSSLDPRMSVFKDILNNFKEV